MVAAAGPLKSTRIHGSRGPVLLLPGKFGELIQEAYVPFSSFTEGGAHSEAIGNVSDRDGDGASSNTFDDYLLRRKRQRAAQASRAKQRGETAEALLRQALELPSNQDAATQARPRSCLSSIFGGKKACEQPRMPRLPPQEAFNVEAEEEEVSSDLDEHLYRARRRRPSAAAPPARAGSFSTRLALRMPRDEITSGGTCQASESSQKGWRVRFAHRDSCADAQES
eukprot:TRINITY_DN15998_c0_g1_i1.p1 TRINITY_DN15998_c0_g1~~TRINITY_DN15998_c0_g1_i1.p1  ORF type:complete len:246 (+),score=53.44 TRINITY_DN15998_c0_g1_i1:65-739(+)